jgi:hypothetical protein
MNFGFVDVVLLNSGHQYVSAIHVVILRVVRTIIKISPNYLHFTIQIMSSLTKLDHNSQHISSMYITPHTLNSNF